MRDVEEIVQKYPEVARRAREVKGFAIDNMDDMLARALQTLQAKSCAVQMARTAEEAVDYITSIARGRSVVKAQSLTAREIDLAAQLQARGIEMLETAFDDYLAQTGANPRSLIPAAIFTGALNPSSSNPRAESFQQPAPGLKPDKVEDVVQAVRNALRGSIAAAAVGITGADAIVAETGSVVLQENEGNARAVSNLPPIHVVVAGIDKIVPTLEDAFAVLRAAALYKTGQPLANYVSIISGPSRTGDIEFVIVKGMHGPQEVHVVLLDNGRTQAIHKGFGEILYCLNCGRCIERCPVYQQMGDRYGSKYPGGRGVVFAAFQQGLEEAVRAGLWLCSGCGACRSVCPVRIDTPRHIRRLREQAQQRSLLGQDIG